MKAGDFAWCHVAFHERDGRSKLRPVLILAVGHIGGVPGAIVAPKYSASEKVRGAVEVVVNGVDSEALGFDRQEGVFRFAADRPVFVRLADIRSRVGSLSKASPALRVRFERAMKNIGL